MNRPAIIPRLVTYACDRCATEFTIAKGITPPGWNDNGAIALCTDCRPNAPINPVSREERQERRLAYRVRMLPKQLDNARRRLSALENEARNLGMSDLIHSRKAIENG